MPVNSIHLIFYSQHSFSSKRRADNIQNMSHIVSYMEMINFLKLIFCSFFSRKLFFMVLLVVTTLCSTYHLQ
uniref:Uncharacterized protein n=1 Tax=Lutzomyia longipalpis TaxID=7200 RepID=A0A1B0CJV2_LUTLO